MKDAIVYLLYNGGERFKLSIEKVISQYDRENFHIFCYDSGSTDGSRKLATNYAKEVVDIKKSDFDFSETKNRIVKKLNGEYKNIIFISQDCIPYNRYWYRNLTGDLGISVASYSRQIVTKIGSKISVSKYYGKKDRIQDLPIRNITDIFFSNACAAYKLNHLNNHLFPNWVYTNEDQIWAIEQILEGYTIKYCSKSLIYNFHDEGIFDGFMKYYDHGNVTGIIYPKLNNYRFEVVRMFQDIIKTIFTSPSLAIKEIFKYLGYFLGSNIEYIPNKLTQKFSKYPDLRSKKDIKRMRQKIRELVNRIENIS